jgi:hypothetical protein
MYSFLYCGNYHAAQVGRIALQEPMGIGLNTCWRNRGCPGRGRRPHALKRTIVRFPILR